MYVLCSESKVLKILILQIQKQTDVKFREVCMRRFLETISNPLQIHEMGKITADGRSEYNKKNQ
jgi:hypothetical protein